MALKSWPFNETALVHGPLSKKEGEKHSKNWRWHLAVVQEPKILHCKDKIPKFRNKYSQKRNIGVSVLISTFICLWAIYIFPLSAYLFCWRKYVDRSWDYINPSQTHECWNWGCGRAIPRKGIYKWDFRCSVQLYQRTYLHYQHFLLILNKKGLRGAWLHGPEANKQPESASLLYSRTMIFISSVLLSNSRRKPFSLSRSAKISFMDLRPKLLSIRKYT